MGGACLYPSTSTLGYIVRALDFALNPSLIIDRINERNSNQFLEPVEITYYVYLEYQYMIKLD